MEMLSLLSLLVEALLGKFGLYHILTTKHLKDVSVALSLGLV